MDERMMMEDEKASGRSPTYIELGSPARLQTSAARNLLEQGSRSMEGAMRRQKTRLKSAKLSPHYCRQEVLDAARRSVSCRAKGEALACCVMPCRWMDEGTIKGS